MTRMISARLSDMIRCLVLVMKVVSMLTANKLVQSVKRLKKINAYLVAAR